MVFLNTFKLGLTTKIFWRDQKQCLPTRKKSRAKMTPSSSVKFWSLLIQIGGGRVHRRQIFISTHWLINMSITKKIGTDQKRSSWDDDLLLDVFVRPSLTVLAPPRSQTECLVLIHPSELSPLNERVSTKNNPIVLMGWFHVLVNPSLGTIWPKETWARVPHITCGPPTLLTNYTPPPPPIKP